MLLADSAPERECYQLLLDNDNTEALQAEVPRARSWRRHFLLLAVYVGIFCVALNEKGRWEVGKQVRRSEVTMSAVVEDADDENAPKVEGAEGDETINEEEGKEEKDEAREHLDLLPQICPSYNGVDFDLIDNREALQMHDGEYYPFLCSQKFLTPDEKILHAVIWIHGFGGNADKYFCDGERFVKEMGRQETTITIAPWFGAEYAYKGEHWAPGLPKGSKMKVWGSFRWMTGEMREIDQPTLTSFEMVDLLVLNLRNKTIYPHLKKITIAGFSAGCQFSSRYAFFSEVPLNIDAEAPVQVIASNCGSYMYLDNRRPSKSCRPPLDDGPEHKCTDFEEPHPAPHGFTKYKVGLTGVKFDEAALQELIDQFPRKNVRFLFGDEDVCDCNDRSYQNPELCSKIARCEPSVFQEQCCDTSPDNKMENVFDVKPASMLQGYNRLQRGLNYVWYLRSYYKGEFPEFDIFRGGHDSEAFAKHPKFMEWALDFPRSDEPALEDPDDAEDPKVVGAHGDETIKEEEEKEENDEKDEAGQHLGLLPQRCPTYDGVDFDLIDNREALQINDGEFYPFLSSQKFLEPDDKILHAVIWIHGFGGNADKYFCDGERFVKEMGRQETTITIAPWFGAEYAYKGEHWTPGLPKGSKMKVWGSFRWMTGEMREIDEPTLTSFEMVDLLALNLRNRTIYPNLKKITIAGFSAGCQFSSRYAFFSEIPLSTVGEAPVHVIASNCGSYMYLDNKRPSKSCRPNFDDGPEHRCTEFEEPQPAPYGFTKYKIGLMGVKFDEVALQKLVDQFPRKNIRFLFGDEDVCDCNDPSYKNPELCSKIARCEPSVFQEQCCDTSPDNKMENVFDVKPASMLQGYNRLQRGLNYVSYLRDYYKGEFPEFDIFRGGHDSEAFAKHPKFMEWALDFPRSDEPALEDPDDAEDPKVMGAHGDETIKEEEVKEEKDEAKEHLDLLPQTCPTYDGVDFDLIDNREALQVSDGEFYPFLCSQKFLERSEKILHAVIWIHGFGGNADKYFCDGERFVKEMGREDTTITIAPWFGAEYAYKGEHWTPGLPKGSKMKVWGSFRWMTGEMREIDEPTLTSFEMVDLLAVNLRNKTIYPNLKKITIAGFSAGCQFSSRYAFFSEVPLDLAGEVPVHVIASNCGSYMYLDHRRPSKSCRPNFDDGPEHRCTEFEAPHPAPYGFTKYKIGLTGVKFDEFALQKLIDQFPKKNIRFLFGDEDVCDCNDPSYKNPELCGKIARCEPSVFQEQCCDTSPDNKMENVFDVKPASMLQGYNRLQRGLNYVSYLRNYYKGDFPEFDIFRGGHDSEAFAKHPKFMEWALDFPRSDEPALEDPDDAEDPKVVGAYGDETIKEEEEKEDDDEAREHLGLLPQRCPTYAGVDFDLIDNREALQVNDGEYYPFLCSHKFLEPDEKILHAVIWIHGFGGNADKYFCDGERFVKDMGRQETTITIAPWFGAEYAYKGEHWTPGLPKGSRMKVWGSFRWMTGEMREIDEPTLTSFEMVDLLALNLRNKTVYPNLKKITIAGFSAGCQFSSRYAFFSEIPLNSNGEAPVHVIASNCGSYMYLDTRRPSKSCRPNFDDGPEHRCTEFNAPHPAPYGFTKYKIGLTGVKFDEVALQRLIDQFPKKSIRFLFGDEDVCDCNDPSYKNPELCSKIARCEPSVFPEQCCDTSPDNKMENVFDVKPASMLQGYNRLQRGLNYVSYLRDYYKGDFPEFDIFRGGHDSEAFAKHPKFMEWALDFPRSDEPALEDPDDAEDPKVIGAHGNETVKEEEVKEEMDEAEEHLDLLPQKCPTFDGVDFDLIDNREALQMHDDEFYPFLCSQKFLEPDEKILHAVIWIHGFGGNADKYFCDGERFVKEMGRQGTTITIAPWFGAEYAYKGDHWTPGLPKDAKMKVWGSFRWMTGEMREIDEPTLTSFEMVDLLVLNLRNKTIYPHLKKITIAGFSAGCQFSSRYAFFSEVPLNTNGEAPVQVIASNCGSYMYLDKTRPSKSCRPNFDDGPEHRCTEFEEPHPAPYGFTKYKVGLTGVKFDEANLQKLIDQFPKKNIRFLFGDEDVCNCNDPSYKNPELCSEIARCEPSVFQDQCCDTSPDNKMENVFDVKPASMLQGYNRLQRGLNYVSYLRNYYKGEFPEFDIFRGGHDSEAFAKHPKFMEWALDFPRSDEPALEDPDDAEDPKVVGAHGDETIQEEEVKEEDDEAEEHLDLLPQKCPTYDGVDYDLIDNREALQMHDGEFYPFLCSQKFLEPDEKILHAVIWIHGFGGNADKYFCDGERFVKEMGRQDTSITIAPWFGAEYAYKGEHWTPGLPNGSKMKVWGSFRWMTGEMREIDEPTLTSFEMVDLLVLNLRNKTIYPHLKKITIAGFSAGCQFSSRYAFFSEVPLNMDGEAPVQVIASNCGSYMYLDKTRPSKSCRPNFDDGPEHRCTEFEEPQPAPYGFTKYKIGLTGVKFDEADLQKLIDKFPKKNIRFLFGDEDVCDCNDPAYKNPELCGKIARCEPSVFQDQCCDTSPDNKMENVFDVKPASMLQGYNRLQRGLNYVSYLRSYYKGEFPEFDIFRGGHDSEAFAKHPKFMEWALDFPRSDEPALEDPDDAEDPKVKGAHGDETIEEEEVKEEKDEAEEHLDLLPQKCPTHNGVDFDLIDNREALQMHDGEYYPFLCSQKFLEPDENILHAIIWIHGFGGNADKYFCDGERFVKEMGRQDSTITIAPWFGAEYAYKGDHWTSGLPEGAKMKVWGSFRWMTGEMREIDEPTLTSFEMVDLLALNLRNKTVYPNLKKITIAGFSAGCQFSSRYAFFSEVPLNSNNEAPVHIIASNCGSYMYLDHRRPSKTCKPNFDDGPGHWCTEFEQPHPAPYGFTKYKIGLNGVKFDEADLQKLIEQFPRKSIRFLFGDEDVCDCNDPSYRNPALCSKIASCEPSVFQEQCCDTSPDNKMENVFDVKPASMLQGYNRLQRGLNYVSYLRSYYKGNFPEFDIFHGGHDSEAFAKHPKFMEWALDYTVSSNRGLKNV